MGPGAQLVRGLVRQEWSQVRALPGISSGKCLKVEVTIPSGGQYKRATGNGVRAIRRQFTSPRLAGAQTASALKLSKDHPQNCKSPNIRRSLLQIPARHP